MRSAELFSEIMDACQAYADEQDDKLSALMDVAGALHSAETNVTCMIERTLQKCSKQEAAK